MKLIVTAAGIGLLVCTSNAATGHTPRVFRGEFYHGEGDVAYCRLLDTARRMFSADPEYQHIAMLYTPAWNGLVEGPTWGAWWIQNSYGPTYCAAPFYDEPYTTFLQNSHDCWFARMGDGTRTWNWRGEHGVIPDGQLCDCANHEMTIYKQGDGRVAIHDWGLEFTAAGLLMQAELLLISRDATAIAHYLPLLERCAEFIETRRDPQNNLFLCGPAANLLAPSYAGWRKPDGTYGMAYLAGLSITYCAALDRLIELEKLAGRTEHAARYIHRRDLTRKGLPSLLTDEGYFVKSIDPDGTRHGVFGAAVHGYFEAAPNHDALCFGVVDMQSAQRIYQTIASIEGLRPHRFIIANYPSLDDMYTAPEGLWGFGTWVNGGHWSTCEARMIMGYYRLDQYEDARRSMEQLLTFATRFRMDNPLVRFGSAVYQPHEPINLCYDSFGPPAAMIRGLFEYRYRADGLTLIPHIPPGITWLQQRFPIRFGVTRVYLAIAGHGPITSVTSNGTPVRTFDAHSVFLPYDATVRIAAVAIGRGNSRAPQFAPPAPDDTLPPLPDDVHALINNWIPVITANDLPLRIGADSAGNSRFSGEIERVRVYTRALTAQEVAQLAGAHRHAPRAEPDLVAAYTFDTLTDGVFANQAGPGLPAKVIETVTVVDSPGGKALRLDGRGFVEIADDPRLDLTEACTMSAWIKPERHSAAGGRIIDKTAVGTSNGYLLDTHPGNSLRAIVQIDTLGHNADLIPGRWVHVAATVKPKGSISLYIDGKVVASREGAPMPQWESLLKSTARLRDVHTRLVRAGKKDTYEAAHARLAVRYLATIAERVRLQHAGKLPSLQPPASQYAADRSYLSTAQKLCTGLERMLARETD